MALLTNSLQLWETRSAGGSEKGAQGRLTVSAPSLEVYRSLRAHYGGTVCKEKAALRQTSLINHTCQRLIIPMPWDQWPKCYHTHTSCKLQSISQCLITLLSTLLFVILLVVAWHLNSVHLSLRLLLFHPCNIGGVGPTLQFTILLKDT